MDALVTLLAVRGQKPDAQSSKPSLAIAASIPNHSMRDVSTTLALATLAESASASALQWQHTHTNATSAGFILTGEPRTCALFSAMVIVSTTRA